MAKVTQLTVDAEGLHCGMSRCSDSTNVNALTGLEEMRSGPHRKT